MIILANLLNTIAILLNSVLSFFLILLFARMILSWVNADPYNQIVRLVTASTDPVLKRIRRKVNLTFGAIDFTPMLVFLIILFLQGFLVTTIHDYAVLLKQG